MLSEDKKILADSYQDGQLILIDKPLEWTSFDIVNKIRYLLKKEFNYKKIKVGHAGTLDPLATGLLIVCTGKQTKQIENYQAQEKEYITTIKLGATTPSYDLETKENQIFETKHITKELLENTLNKFIGEQAQVPPIFSAQKVNGKRAYKIARQGENVALKAKTINIYNIQLLDLNMPFFEVKIKCSKGTYIRSIARDIGIFLDSGAYLNKLRRTKIGDFSVENALSIFEFEKKVLSL